MRRLTRPLGYAVFALAALWGFIRLRTATPTPLDWSHPSDWLSHASATDVLIEIARWTGIGLAAYVALIAFLALVVEAAALTRIVPIERTARFIGRLVTVPALRSRLLDASTAAAITVASLNIAASGVPAAPVPTSQVVDEPATTTRSVDVALPPTLDASMFHGFGYAPPPPTTTEQTPTSDRDTATVARGETLWGIATAHYGFCDQNLIHIVHEANPEIDDPSRIYAGQTIVLPELFPDVLSTGPDFPGDEATWAVHAIVPGDTLWDILDDHYGDVDADLVWHIAGINGLENPSDIPVGTQITLPPREDSRGTTPQVVETPPQSEQDPADNAAGPEATTSTRPQPEPVDDTASPSPRPDNERANPAMVPTAPAADPVDLPAQPSSAHAAEPSSEADGDGVMASLAHRIGWNGSTALAAGLIALAAQLRRERRRRDERPPTEPVRDVDLVMRTAPITTTVEWAAETLRGLTSQLRPRAGIPFPIPMCVQLDDDGMEILWTAPRPHLTDGWTTPNNGRSWHRSRQLSPVDATVAALCPGLVTVGTHDGTDVLLNLEVPGILNLTGDRAAALDAARSLCLELGSTPFKDITNLLLCAFPLDGIEHLEWVKSVTIDEAANWLRDRRESARAHLSHHRLDSLFGLRASLSRHDAHAPVVVVVDANEIATKDVERLADLADPSAGAIVITIGASGMSTAWDLECTASSTTLGSLGLRLEPVAVSAPMSSTIATFLDYAAGDDINTGDVTQQPDEREVEPSDDLHAAPRDTAQTVVARIVVEPPKTDEAGPPIDAVAAAAPVECAIPAVVFRILGPVGIEGLDAPLRPTELELGIYLALHPHGQTADTIRTMIWPNGSADKTWRNVSSSLRTKLGCDPDGSHRLSSRGNLGRYLLAPTVTTDLDLLLATVAASDGLAGEDLAVQTRAAFDLIRGPLFSDTPTGYSWAYSDGTTTRIELDLARLTTELAGRLRNSGLDADADWISCRASPITGESADSRT